MLSAESITKMFHTTKLFSTSSCTIALELHDTSQPGCQARNNISGEPLRGQVSYSLLQFCCAVTMSFIILYFSFNTCPDEIHRHPIVKERALLWHQHA